MKLVDEIDQLDREDKLSTIVTFAEANQMSYLQACMKEAMRMHPAVGQLLERVVPQGGFTIAGVWLPEGTILGMNPWVPSKDRSVYGNDADEFRPERWLEADASSLRLMERNFLAVSVGPWFCSNIANSQEFGSGARTCMGKNISLLEMSKLVPQLLRNYNIQLSEPGADWTLSDYWFVKQTNVNCHISRRKR